MAMVVVVAGCAFAAWWQATRALGGNTLSWAYTVEWPIFGIIAIGGWWQLIHEDPEAYKARKNRPRYSPEQALAAPPLGALPGEGDDPAGPGEVTVEPVIVKRATRLAAGVGFEFVLGVMALLSVPLGRPGGWLPAKGEVVYLAHAGWGLMLMPGAVALIVKARGKSRGAQIAAWLGISGISLAGLGGLLTAATSLVRFLGIVLMLLGTAFAAFGYMVPVLLTRSRRVPATPVG